VFVSRLRQLFSLKLAFEAIKLHVEAVTGSTGKEKRDAIVNRFKEGHFPVLINCGALVEGADMPCVSTLPPQPSGRDNADCQIDCVVLARPTKSQILVTQMVSIVHSDAVSSEADSQIGRGMRVSRETDKKDCLILDFTVSSKSGLKRFPELYALVDDLGVSKARATKPRPKKYVKPALKPKRPVTPQDEESDDDERAAGNFGNAEPAAAKAVGQSDPRIVAEPEDANKEAGPDDITFARHIDNAKANELFNRLAAASCTAGSLVEAIELTVGNKGNCERGDTLVVDDSSDGDEILVVGVDSTPESSRRHASSPLSQLPEVGVKRKWAGSDDDDVVWVSD
jgi:hypothetical protein